MQEERNPDASTSAPISVVQETLLPESAAVHVPILPEKNVGTLRGGMYPFVYDPVYGLPLVQEIATYGEVLRDMREGRVKGIYWFNKQSEAASSLLDFEGRCETLLNGKARMCPS
jgi:hypothetical protein